MSRDFVEQNKKPVQFYLYRLLLVPRTGIEPAHPCGHQILSLTRLPIPPSGQQAANVNGKG